MPEFYQEIASTAIRKEKGDQVITQSPLPMV